MLMVFNTQPKALLREKECKDLNGVKERGGTSFSSKGSSERDSLFSHSFLSAGWGATRR